MLMSLALAEANCWPLVLQTCSSWWPSRHQCASCLSSSRWWRGGGAGPTGTCPQTFSMMYDPPPHCAVLAEGRDKMSFRSSQWGRCSLRLVGFSCQLCRGTPTPSVWNHKLNLPLKMTFVFYFLFKGFRQLQGGVFGWVCRLPEV